MIPSCFGNTKTLPKNPQNLINSIYQTHFKNSLIQLTWSRTISSHSLTISSPHPHCFSFTISLSPPTFFLFPTRPGSKSISLTRLKSKLKLYWDFTRAEFSQNSAEPRSLFYLAVFCQGKIVFFLGDLWTLLAQRVGPIERQSPTDPTLVSRREHLFGKRKYMTSATFLGAKHDIGIECGGRVLVVKIDGEVRLVVKRLGWKFRGNERILVGGVEVEFYWDVFNWVSGNSKNEGGGGYGVFGFQIGDGGPTSEMVGPEKKLMGTGLVGLPTMMFLSTSSSATSTVLQWAEESSDGGKSSCSSSTKSSGSGGSGFSLILYAWRREYS